MELTVFALAVLVLVGLGVLTYFVPVGLWIAAFSSGAYVGIGTLIAMRLRRVPPSAIVKPRLRLIPRTVKGCPGRGVPPVFSGAYFTPRKPGFCRLLGIATKGGRSTGADFSLVTTEP